MHCLYSNTLFKVLKIFVRDECGVHVCVCVGGGGGGGGLYSWYHLVA